jgi:uncharacterized protein with GYD domain
VLAGQVRTDPPAADVRRVTACEQFHGATLRHFCAYQHSLPNQLDVRTCRRLARQRVAPSVLLIDAARVPVEADVAERHTGQQRQIRSACLCLGVVTVAKYLVLFSLTGETIRRFLDKPSDRAAVVRDLAESVGGSLESYYWMFGQYDGAAVFVLPDSHTMAALSLAATSSGAFTRFETHELIDANDLLAIADRAKGIAYQPPGG